MNAVAVQVALMDRPALRMRAELRGRRYRLTLYTVGLPTRYHRECILQREVESFRWCKLRR